MFCAGRFGERSRHTRNTEPSCVGSRLHRIDLMSAAATSVPPWDVIAAYYVLPHEPAPLTVSIPGRLIRGPISPPLQQRMLQQGAKRTVSTPPFDADRQVPHAEAEAAGLLRNHPKKHIAGTDKPFRRYPPPFNDSNSCKTSSQPSVSFTNFYTLHPVRRACRSACVFQSVAGQPTIGRIDLVATFR